MYTPNGEFYLQILVNDRLLQEYPYQEETFIEGIIGRNFTLRLGKSQHYRRGLAVVSLDGLSIMDGKPAKSDGRGYIIENGENYIDIPGWRLNDRETAAFYFASLPEAYASQMGKPTNIGVIGAKFFYEKQPTTTYYPDTVISPYPPTPYGTPPPPPPASAPSAPLPAMPSQAPYAPGAVPIQSPASAPPPSPSQAPSAPGVGAGFGKRQAHSVHTVKFESDQATAQILMLRYDTAENLEARGIVLPGRGDRVMQADPFPGDSGCTPPQGWRG
jgi:hypothetical protein